MFIKVKKSISLTLIVALIVGIISASFAEPTEDLQPSTEPTTIGKGPEVVEYYEYKEDKVYAPGSLSGDVNFSTVGKGLYYDGDDYYFFLDTGVIATNFMFTIEGNRFYFGEDGKMVKDELVSYNGETYYFDPNGVMYKNQWYTYEEVDTYENTITYIDYYFGPTGRAYRAGDGSNGLVVKTIEDQKFGFNADGEKLEGFYDASGNKLDPAEEPAFSECIYFFDPEDNGAAITGWYTYTGQERGTEYDSNEEIVLYFDEKTCKKVAAKSSDNSDRCVSRIIDGQRYMFDKNGVRKNKWYSTEPGRGTSSNARFFSEEEDGYLQKGWFMAVPGSYDNWESELILDVNKERHKSDEEVWFYAGSNGNILRKTIRKIGNSIYAFDDDGVMQQEALVKVRSGSFVKAYDTAYLYKANVLYDYKEYGGVCADSDPYGPTNPTNLDHETGILNSDEKEQWMYFKGESDNPDGDVRAGAQCRYNSPVKIELCDDDIYFICNSAGGYGIYATTDDDSELGAVNLTEAVERGNKLIQNGVLLKPNSDDNNYGLVRTKVTKSTYYYNPKRINAYNCPLYATMSEATRYTYRVVNSTGTPLNVTERCIKDKSGYYIYIGVDPGELVGVYSCQGKYVDKSPKTVVDPDDNTKLIAREGYPCWMHKRDGEKEWAYGLPPIDDRIPPDYLYLNFSEKSELTKGPYVDGIAADMYDDAHLSFNAAR